MFYIMYLQCYFVINNNVSTFQTEPIIDLIDCLQHYLVFFIKISTSYIYNNIYGNIQIRYIKFS